jgi:RND superfamily putative drug exporter
VWIFQDGHGAGLLQVTPAPLEVGIVVLMAAVVFGLSTDYEVFLLSRMVEARTRGASTAEAVTTGLARTGRVISAAAVLLIVVTGAFALSAVTTMRFVGVGMIIALLLDATIVRMLLVPALLGLLGGAAWWAPGPLRRLQERAGLAEYAGEELFPTVSVGRHAAPDDAPATSSSTAPPRHGAKPVVTGVVVASEDVTPWPVTASASASVAALPAPAPMAALPAGVAPAAETTGRAGSVSPPVSRSGAIEMPAGPAALSVPVTPGRSTEPPVDAPPKGVPSAASDADAAASGSEASSAAAVGGEDGNAGDGESPGLDETVAFDVPSPAAASDADADAAPAAATPVSPSGAGGQTPDATPESPAAAARPAAPPRSPFRFAGTTAARPVSPANRQVSPAAPPASAEADGASPEPPAAAPTSPAAPADGDQPVDDLHGPTVDLASRVAAEEEPTLEDDPNPETTAVLELHPTANVAHHDPAPEESHPRK